VLCAGSVCFRWELDFDSVTWRVTSAAFDVPAGCDPGNADVLEKRARRSSETRCLFAVEVRSLLGTPNELWESAELVLL